MRKLVYIASPLSGDVETNLSFARQACLNAISQGATPFAPHLLYPQMLDDNDPAQRELGMRMGNQMLSLCDKLWLCGDIVSPGMIHVGDITKLDGAKLPPVDIICGGSPCQDLSVAGPRSGLAGARSGLFMEQIRIVIGDESGGCTARENSSFYSTQIYGVGERPGRVQLGLPEGGGLPNRPRGDL